MAVFVLIVFLSMFIITTIYTLLKKTILGEHTIEITPDYFRGATDYNDDNKYDWHKIKKIKKTRRYIFIGISSFLGVFIPLRDFSNTEEYNKFYELAASYHNQAKKNAN